MESTTTETNDTNEQGVNEEKGRELIQDESKHELIEEILSLQIANEKLERIKKKMEHLINDS